jgi:transmembrane sensor
MDLQASYNEEQWELMLSALQGELSAEERIVFDQWLGASPVNRETYEQLERTWREGLADYLQYSEADEGAAWEALQRKLGARRVKEAPPARSRHMPGIGPWLVAAALVVLLAEGGLYFLKSQYIKPEYITGVTETKHISLPDGTKMELEPSTKMEIPSGYNRAFRALRLVSGKASFEVVHDSLRPFSVETDGVRVEDLGTKFTMEKTADSVRVHVTEGRVAFVQIRTGEKRELGAGESLSVYTGADSLRFSDAPLADILSTLERHSGQKIQLNDASFAGKRLTLNLNGETLENSLRIICASLNLEYTLKAGVYVLDKKK